MNVEHRPPPGKYRLTVDDFMRLDETGVFGTDRTELLDGDVIIMNAEYRPDAWIAGEIGYQLRRLLEAAGSDYTVLTSIAVSDHDLPLPDVVVTREPQGEGPVPLPSVGLVVEVAASTLGRDLRDKRSIYARASIPEYWVIDVNGRIIHRMWSPQDADYAGHDEIPFGQPLTAATIPGLTIATDRL